MPRSRMIRPEYFSDQKLAKISIDARHLFTGLWVFADDNGNVIGNPVWLKSTIRPYDNIPIDKFEKWLKELEAIRVILPYHAEGEDFYHIKNFLVHQKISHPSTTNYDPQPVNLEKLIDAGESPESNRRVAGETPYETEVKLKQKLKQKLIFGEFRHIKLTQQEYDKLIEKFGKAGADEWIQKVDEGIELKGYKYNSHYLAILNWYRNEEKRKTSSQPEYPRSGDKLNQLILSRDTGRPR